MVDYNFTGIVRIIFFLKHTSTIGLYGIHYVFNEHECNFSIFYRISMLTIELGTDHESVGSGLGIDGADKFLRKLGGMINTFLVLL